MSTIPDYVPRRDELRSLSRARVEAGLDPFPSAEEVQDYAKKYGVREIDAHTYFMEQGVRILELKRKQKEKDETENGYGIVEEWRVVDQWWTEEPTLRDYREVQYEDGRKVTLFREGENGPWVEVIFKEKDERKEVQEDSGHAPEDVRRDPEG